MLVVVLVKGGLIGEWNAAHPERQVEPGHRVVEVNGLRGIAEGLKAKCRHEGELTIRLQRPVAAHAALEIPDSSWMRVVWFLHTHEILSRFVTLSTRLAALLGDERSWQNLVVPAGPSRLQKLLRLMVIDEKDLWAWPLCQVQQLDLDLRDCDRRTLGHVQKVLQCLDLCDTLQTLALRHVSTQLQADEEEQTAQMTTANRNLIRLVNPVLPSFPAYTQVVFLLAPTELGQLRLKLSCFGHFRILPDDSRGSVTLVAARGPLPVLEEPPSLCEHAVGERAAQLLEMELGELGCLSSLELGLPYAQWADRLMRVYAILASGGRSSASASLLGGATGSI